MLSYSELGGNICQYERWIKYLYLRSNHDLKIFISYSKNEAGVYAEKLSQSLIVKGYYITNNVVNCDVFLLIITQSSMIDSELQKDYFLARVENKRIIPYIYNQERSAGRNWGFNKIRGFSFSDVDVIINKISLLLNSNDGLGIKSDKSHNILSSTPTNKLNQKRKLKNISVKLLVICVCSLFFIYPFMFHPSDHNSEEYYKSGMNFAKSGQYRESITDFNKAIELDPGHVNAYYSKGTAFESLGDYTGAIENYNKAIELDPGHVNAYYSKGTAFESLGDYTGAIENYNKAIELDPGHVNAY
jgi:tetratricopeptide (TPR) repeat protein